MCGICVRDKQLRARQSRAGVGRGSGEEDEAGRQSEIVPQWADDSVWAAREAVAVAVWPALVWCFFGQKGACTAAGPLRIPAC